MARIVVCCTLVLCALAAPCAVAAEPAPLGLGCSAAEGVRLCLGDGAGDRVPSWDGTPLDADVTIPPTGNGPWPTIVLLNGLGGNKTQLQEGVPAPPPSNVGVVIPSRSRHSNLWFARRGYAVLAFSSRGFGASCGAGGVPASLVQAPPCDRGFVRIADLRYEARDAQHLAGLLADEGIAEPRRIGATGFSYGGGESVELAYLRDRVMCPGAAAVAKPDPCAGKANGELVPWTSPRGAAMEVRAVYGQWLWSDLIASLLPNGRFLDHDPATNATSLDPLGIFIQSYVTGLFALAQGNGYVLRPQLPGSPDLPWDLLNAVRLLAMGEPYGADALALAKEYRRFHSGFGLPGKPAAMLLESGWNDDLFPPSESIRAYNDVLSRDPSGDVVLLLGDLGHARDANKLPVNEEFNRIASDFFDSRLKDEPGGPAPGSAVRFTSSCPAFGSTLGVDAGPFRSASWTAAHPGAVVITAPDEQVVESTGGDHELGLQFDPVSQTNPLGTTDPCKTVPARVPSGVARFEVSSQGFTLMGLPTVLATISASGDAGQLAGRLWDVAPDGSQRLVTRGGYRVTPGQQGPVTFQLHGNGYRFAPGHVAKLELSGSDAPYMRASNGTFTVRVREATVVLPTLDVPGTTAQIVQPPTVVRSKVSAPVAACARPGRASVVLPPRRRGERRVRVIVRAPGHKTRTLRGRSIATRKRLELRGLWAGRLKVKLVARVRTRAGRTRTLTRVRVVRVCR